MPTEYVYGVPVYWLTPAYPELASAMQTTLAWLLGQTGPPTREQWELVLAYCRYYAHAPCWENNPLSTDEHREALGNMRWTLDCLAPEDAEEDFADWRAEAQALGIDPF